MIRCYAIKSCLQTYQLYDILTLRRSIKNYKEMIYVENTKIISMSALKGGTGKTLITFNIAVLLAKKYKKKVLVIDIDAQHNMTNLLYGPIKRMTYGMPQGSQSGDRAYTSEDIFERGVNARGVIKKSQIRGIDIIPTTIGMTATELRIAGMAGRELILKNWFYDNEDTLKKYDYIFFDTNPTMSTINTNAYIICDDIILISDVDVDGINAVHTFLELYYPIQRKLDRQMEDNISGLIINKLQDVNVLDRDFLEWIESDQFEFSDILLDTKIHYATALAHTKVDRDHIDKSKNSRSYEEFIAIIEELFERGVF